MATMLDAVIQLKDNFSNTIKTVEKNVGGFSRTTKKMGRDVQRVGKDLEGFGKSMTTHVTLPTIALGTASLKSAMDLEDGVAKISTIADTTKMSLEDIRKGLLDISDVTGIVVTDLAEAEYNAISAGVDTAKSLEFIETASKTSKAGFADMDTTIDALTTTLNAYGLGTEKAMDISNQMLLAQDYGKTTVAEMGASLGNVIPIASQLGVSTEELFASMATLTKNGIKTSEAVTGLKGAYSNILKPSSQASKLAESLGLNFNAAHLQSVGWAKFLDEVKEKTGGNAEQMAQLFGSVQGLNSVMVLTGKGNKDFNNVLGQMGDVAGLTDKKFEQLLTPTQKLKIEFNKLKNTGIEFGVELIPLVTQFTEKLGQVTEKIKNLSPEQRQMIIKFAGIAAAVGPIILVIGRMTTGVGKLIIKFGLFAGKLKIGKTLIQAIFVPGVKVALVISGIIAAVVLLIKNFDKLKTKVSEVKTHFSGLKDVAKSLKDNLIGLKDKAVTKTKEKFEEFKDVLVDNQDAIKTTAAILGTVFGPALVKTGVQAAKSGGKIAGSFIANIVKTGVQAAISGAKVTASFVASVIKAGKEAVIAGGKVTIQFVGSLIKASKQAVITAGTITGQLVASLVRYAVQGWKTVISIVATTGAWIAQKAAMMGSAIATGAMTIAQRALNAAMNANPIAIVIGLVVGLSTVLVILYKKCKPVRDAFNAMWGGIKHGAIVAVNGIISAINFLIKGLNKIKLPKWVPKIGGKGINIPLIPKLAKGTSNWQGGIVQVHEQGGEIIDLPRGSRVYPHDESVTMAKEQGRRESKGILITGNTFNVREETDIDKIAVALARKIEKASLNMA
jgi:TP901 family phage tail tape measure protein